MIQTERNIKMFKMWNFDEVKKNHTKHTQGNTEICISVFGRTSLPYFCTE